MKEENFRLKDMVYLKDWQLQMKKLRKSEVIMNRKFIIEKIFKL